MGKEHNHAHNEGHTHDHGGIFGKRSELIFSLLCGVLLGIGYLLSQFNTSLSGISLAAFILAYGCGGYYTLGEANRQYRRPTNNTIITLNTCKSGPSLAGDPLHLIF